MAGAKETPRQKMIGMMYLVLTALLALNVSRDILNAFIIVNEALVVSKENLREKNLKIIENFRKANILEPAKVGPYLKKAEESMVITDKLVKLINDVKIELIKRIDGKDGGDTLHLSRLDKKDEFDVATFIMCGTDEATGSNGKANEIKKGIEEFIKSMIELLPERMRKEVDPKLGFDLSDKYNHIVGKTVTWELYNFYHTVLAADIALLNNIIVQVYNAQTDILNKLWEAVSAEDFKFDTIDGKVIPNATVLTQGSEYVAQIFVAAYSKTQAPVAFIKTGTDTMTEADTVNAIKIIGENGVCTYRATAGMGETKYAGLVRMRKPNGEYKTYHIKGSYMGMKPTATVSPDKMNVFYIGLENPVSISASGVPNEKVKASMTGGQLISKGGGHYIVKPDPSAKEATISVSAEIQGKVTNMGQYKFRIKRVPPPIPTVAGKNSGEVSRGVVKNAPFVLAQLDETFLFEGVKFNVVSFTALMSEGGTIKLSKPHKGSKFDQTTVNMIASCKPGTKLIVDDIKAVGPDGATRSLPPVSIVLK